MRKSVCRILWMLPVLTMLLVNNSILSAQLLEETTAFTERDRNSVDAKQENDDFQKVWPWKTYYTVTLKSINCSYVYGAMNYVFIKVNGEFVWSDDMSIGTETLSITKTSVPSSESIELYIGSTSNSSSAKRVGKSLKLKEYVGKGNQTFPFTKGSKITVRAEYTVTFEVISQ